MDTRYLGVDLGTKRIGLAISDPHTGVVSPLSVINTRAGLEQNASAIIDVAEEYDAGGIVIGLPLNMDGTEGPQARLSKQLAEAIRKACQARRNAATITVHLHDERLTSHAADRRLLGRDLTRKKKKNRQDAIAAQVLLESFLDRLTGKNT
ncbi:MAG TPA: Holliday junction resolvase RuvX [Phycisphaerae bacterium]|nr:Holliday junction resolvase RuvX [Phycisphaerae bacterium]HRR84355.1 Holliday junction resolvase RuvX [Phycisphaerae bacterium]